MKIEWVIVKGVSQFANDLDPPNNLWKSFACTMAASLVFNMLNDPLVFKNWPHFDGKCSSAWLTGVTLYTVISRKIFGKTVHATIPKGNIGYDQYTVPDTVAVELSFVAFL